jgi:hypothetical protein
MEFVEQCKYGSSELTADQRLCIEEIENVRRLAMRKALVAIYTQYYTNLVYEGKFDEIIPKIKEIREALDTSDDAKASEWQLITINPKDTIPFCQIEDTIIRIVNKKWITQYIYTFEQRSVENEPVKGIHIHLMLKRNGKVPSAVKKEIKNTCVRICDINNPHILNFKNLREDKDVLQAYNYLTGFKADPEKHPKQYKDVQWREEMGISPFYRSEVLDLNISPIDKQDASKENVPPEKDNSEEDL